MSDGRVDVSMLLAHAATAWREWLRLGLLTLTSGLVGLLHPWPLKLLIDHALGGVPLPIRAERFRGLLPGAGSSMGLALYVAAAGVLLFAVDAALDAASQRAWIATGQGVVYRFAARVFAHAQRLSPVRHARLRTGDLLATVTGDSWCAYGIAGAVVFTPAQAALMIGIALTILWRIEPTLALASLAVVPPMTLVAALAGRWGRASFGRQREGESRVESHVQQTLAGIPLVQSFSQEDRHVRELVALSGAATRAQQRAALVGGLGHLLSGTVAAVGSAVVMILGADRVRAGSLSVGDLLVFLAYLGLMQGELANLLASYATLAHARASLARVATILAQPIEVASPASPALLPSDAATAVELEDVWFGYDPATPVVCGGSLRVAAGETIGLVGPSGGGKSTIALLVSRLVDPARGVVRVFGVDARRLDLAQLRQHARLVLQDPNIQSGTIRETLLLGDPDAGDEPLWHALRLAGLDEFVGSLDGRLDAEVGEAGATLSGGQQQRLSLARALVGEPRILILDEPTSMLDAQTESRVIDAILTDRRLARLTTILISHRESTIRDADRVFEVVAGVVRARVAVAPALAEVRPCV